MELLQHCRELEGTSLEHGLAATLAGIQLTKREAAVDHLLRQNRGLMELLGQQRALMEGPLSRPVMALGHDF